MALVLSYVAPPGYSQHHTGNAVDLAVDRGTFAKTKAYQWLQKNAKKFGFTETYPKENKQRLPWEPWHWFYSSAD
jgi:D-alanyl-D-alanine carboxypeptidase